MLEFQSVFKTFRVEEERIHVVNDANFRIETGEFVAIIGPSGSGKSTLLGLAAGLDKPDSGRVLIDGVDIAEMDEDSLAEIRSKNIGFVFQNFQLLPNLTAIENVSIPLMISGELRESQIRDKAMELLRSVSMDHRANHFPQQLSGGEEQRIAIARSFVNEPKILFADEPTANLDSKNGKMVMDLLKDLNREKGSTLVVVTHDPKVASLADRVFEMMDGNLISGDKVKGSARSKSSAKPRSSVKSKPSMKPKSSVKSKSSLSSKVKRK
jgi:putative ABC transport system ATP-binding protein